MKQRERNGPVVYVASAFSGDVERNVEKTRQYSRFVVDSGASPLNPILNLLGVMSEKTERDAAMSVDIALLEKCADELWVFGEPTEGMLIEIIVAQEKRIPIRWFTQNMEEL